MGCNIYNIHKFQLPEDVLVYDGSASWSPLFKTEHITRIHLHIAMALICFTVSVHRPPGSSTRLRRHQRGGEPRHTEVVAARERRWARDHGLHRGEARSSPTWLHSGRPDGRVRVQGVATGGGQRVRVPSERREPGGSRRAGRVVSRSRRQESVR